MDWAQDTPERGGAGFPPPSWPTRSQLDYTRTLVVVVILLLALPYLVGRLLTNPGAVLEGLGKRVAGSVGP